MCQSVWSSSDGKTDVRNSAIWNEKPKRQRRPPKRVSEENAAALTFRDIQIEEVAVEDCLYDPGNDGNHVEESLEVEPPYPVEEVKGSVESQEEQVVGGDGLGLTGLADHEKLRQDGHRLQVDGESPQDLGRTEEGAEGWWER